jgi:hypothetical protein
MNSIAEVVFILSPRAIAALASDSKDLDPQLLTLLALVDGVTPVAQYQPFLRSLGPIEPKFIALEVFGYLLRVGTVSTDAVKAFQNSVEAGGSISTLHSIDARAPASGFIPLP